MRKHPRGYWNGGLGIEREEVWSEIDTWSSFSDGGLKIGVVEDGSTFHLMWRFETRGGKWNDEDWILFVLLTALLFQTSFWILNNSLLRSLIIIYYFIFLGKKQIIIIEYHCNKINNHFLNSRLISKNIINVRSDAMIEVQT